MIVYKATNRVNGKSYIGKTVKSLIARKGEHLTESKIHRKNYHFYNAINKHGWDSFDWEVLYNGDDDEDIREQEILFIESYDTFNDGYNMTEGGEGTVGHSQSDEWKDYMRTNNPMFNPETRAKVAETKRNQPFRGWDDKFGKERADEVRESHSKRMQENNPMFDAEVVERGKKSKKKYYKSDKYTKDRKSLNKILIDKLAKKWIIITPDGEEFEITNLNGYCKKQGLSSTCMAGVADGIRRQHKGFRCKRS